MTAMKGPEELPSLKALGDDIGRMHAKIAPQPKSPSSGTDMALRVGIELVSGVLVGTGAGVLLDKWLGTSPFLLIVCFFLGAAGGFLTIYRMTKNGDGEQTNESDKTK